MRIGINAGILVATTIVAVGSTHAQGRPAGPPALVKRADSIEALNPATEVRKAIDRGDVRFIAICGYACYPPGVDLTDSTVTVAIRSRAFHYVEGTSDAIMSEAVARLNIVAAAYAERYNRLLARHLHVREAPEKPRPGMP